MLSDGARMLRERGVVREQWEPTGTKIEYCRSNLQRGGWNIPGPLNLDEEEEDNVDQDDIHQGNNRDVESGELAGAMDSNESLRYKRYFFQMNFELEFPHEDDTVYLAYSRPYPYSEIIAHMFDVESRLIRIGSKRERKHDIEQHKSFRLKISRGAFVYERNLLCTTICGLPVPKIYITANKQQPATPITALHKRKTIIVTARVHPGETSASSVFEGFLNKLAENVDHS